MTEPHPQRPGVRPGIRPGVARLFRLALRRRDRFADIDAEIQHHLDAREQQLVARGLDRVEARVEAQRRFGDITEARARLHALATRREHRMQLHERLASMVHDLRIVWRGLRRAPGFLAVAVACLALGIGANAAVFSVVDAVLLKPLPFRDADGLLRVWDRGYVPAGVLDIVRGSTTTFEQLAGFEDGRAVSLNGADSPTRVLASRTTSDLFDVLGVTPAMGSGFGATGDVAAGARVVAISYALWRDRFGGRSDIVGQRIQLDGIPHSVVAVMPAAFRFPAADVQLWTPLQVTRGSVDYWWGTFLQMVGRVRGGVTVQQARADAALAIDRARGAFPQRMPDDWGRDITLAPLQESIVGGSRPLLLLLLGAVGLVLLVACVNVATLCLGRASARSRELAVRSALGAGRGRIVRLLLLESATIAALGTVAGLALAAVTVRLLVSIVPPGTPRADEIALDARVGLFCVGLMALSTMLFGLMPALRASRTDLVTALKTTEPVSTRLLRLRTSSVLVVSQLALAVVLVAGAGLLIKSFLGLRDTSLGFRTADVMTTKLPLPSFPNDTASRAWPYYAAVIEQARALPGVRAAAVASAAPFGDGIQSAAMAVEAHPTPAGGVPPLPAVTAVSDDYFRTLGIPLKRGRMLSGEDRAGTTRVALIDETAARTLWPGQDPIGQRIRYVWAQEWITVVGVVGAIRRDSLSGVAEPSLYLPMRQSVPRAMRLLVHVAESGAPSASAIEGAVRAVDATVPIEPMRPLAELVSSSAARSRFAALLLSLFAGSALLLGAVGVYGVTAASVTSRTREIGVRLALGATSAQVQSMVLRQSLGIAAAGVALGLVGVVAGARAISAFLHDVSPFDAGILLAVALVLAAVALLSAAVPARRASRVDPSVAMKGG